MLKETNKEKLENIEEIKKDRENWEIALKYKPLIIKSIKTYYNKTNQYDDLIQEGYLKIYELCKNYKKERGSMGAYLKTNLKYYYLEKNRKIEAISLEREDGPILETLKSDENIEEDYLLEESARRLKKALRGLTDIEREVLVGIYFEGKKASEIAKEQKRSKAAVSQAKKRGLEKLKKSLEK